MGRHIVVFMSEATFPNIRVALGADHGGLEIKAALREHLEGCGLHGAGFRDVRGGFGRLFGLCERCLPRDDRWSI